MWKRGLSVLMAVLLAAGMGSALAGCKKKSGGGDDGPPTDLKGTVIRSYTWGDEATEEDKKRDAYIEEKTGATIEYTKIAYGNMDMKYVLDVSAGNAPDLVYLTDERFPRYTIKGLTQPLNDYADAFFGADDPWWKLVQEKSDYVWQGKIYGGSTGAQPYYLWYNKTMFEENDVKTPLEYYNEGKWDWEALSTIGNQLVADTDKDGKIDRWALSTWKIDNLIIGNDGNFFEFTPDSLRLTMEDQKVVNALEYIQKSAFTEKWYTFDGDWFNGFKNGSIAMILETTWVRHALGDDVKFEIDFVPSPLGPDNTSGARQGFGTASGICTNAQNPYGALAYMKYGWEYGNQRPYRESEYASLYTEEQLDRLEEYDKLDYKVSFLYGVGAMSSKANLFYEDIIENGMPVATAIATHKDTWQYEINVTLSDIKLPEVLPFTAPPKLDFEDDAYKDEIIFTDTEGNLTGIAEPEITDESGVAIDGKSVRFTIEEGEPYQLFRFADKYTFPAYHTYTIKFDYRALKDMGEEGRLMVALCPKDSTVVGPHTAFVTLTGVEAGDSGTFEGDIDVYEYPEGYTLAVVGVDTGDIVLDNFEVIDKTQS